MNWHHVAQAGDLAIGAVLGCEAGGRRIALFRLPDGFYATDEFCPHAFARLSRGSLDGDTIRCPAHFARFDIRTGRGVPGGVDCDDLETHPVRVEGERVEVAIAAR